MDLLLLIEHQVSQIVAFRMVIDVMVAQLLQTTWLLKSGIFACFLLISPKELQKSQSHS